MIGTNERTASRLPASRSRSLGPSQFPRSVHENHPTEERGAIAIGYRLSQSMGGGFQKTCLSVSICCAVLFSFMVVESMGGLVAYKYSPLGGELRFIRNPQRPMVQRGYFNSLPRSFGYSGRFDPEPAAPLSSDESVERELLSKPDTPDILDMPHERRNPFESFLRLWTTPGNGRIRTGPKMNWKHFVQQQ